MKLNTNSNVYTFVYMTIVVIIVAVLLALANQALKPRQDANILLDKQKQILGALKVDFSQADPAEVYYTLVQDTLKYGDAHSTRTRTPFMVLTSTTSPRHRVWALRSWTCLSALSSRASISATPKDRSFPWRSSRPVHVPKVRSR